MKARASLLLCALAALSAAQAPPTLAEYLKAHPAEDGLTVNEEGAKAGAEGSGLGRYGRKLVRVGGVAAVVPETMVRYEESPKEPPNLYDGLPRDAKVTYLMSILDAGQWATAAKEGIGLGDLRGEQRKVFLSLLPPHPSWHELKVSEDHGWGPIVGHGELSPEERPSMRLRIEQNLQIDLRIAGPVEGTTGASPSSDLGKPGETVRMRDTHEDDDAQGSYGVTLRAVVPNAPKKGQLDTANLGQTVTLPARTTVGEALAILGRVTGREVLADVRVRGLSMAWPGGPARAGDLLDALALGVAGTYRRVDGSFLLVADVVGAGARKLRLMLWKEVVDSEIARRKLAWTAALMKSGLAQKAGFPEDPLLAATPEVKRRLDAGRKDPIKIDWFSTSELSPEQREFVAREIARDKDVTIEPDKVAVLSTLRYRFVLPDGTALQTEGYLGPMENYVPKPPRAPMGPDPEVPKAANPEGSVRSLIVRPASAEEARRAVAMAKAYGFTELWVETERTEVLAEAARGGLPTRLFVRPWTVAAGREGSDRTILGEGGRTVAATQATDPLWLATAAKQRLQSYPRRGPKLADGDLLSPLDPAWPARRNAIAGLARTPGLAGVVVADATPHGYEADERHIKISDYSPVLQEAWSFGYDERSRLAFFRRVGYDPVDLTTEELDFDMETDTPTFPRYPARPLALVREAYTAWTAHRAELSATALKGLRDTLGNVPVLVEVRRAGGWQPPRGDETLAPWALGEAPPSYDDQYVPAIPGSLGLVCAPDFRMKDAMADFVNAVRIFAPMAEVPHAFDLTRLSASRWDETLAAALKPR